MRREYEPSPQISSPRGGADLFHVWEDATLVPRTWARFSLHQIRALKLEGTEASKAASSGSAVSPVRPDRSIVRSCRSNSDCWDGVLRPCDLRGGGLSLYRFMARLCGLQNSLSH